MSDAQEIKNELIEGLKEAVTQIIQLANADKVQQPLGEYKVSWFEQTSDSHAIGKEESRHEFQFQNLNTSLLEKIKALESVKSLQNKAEEIARNYNQPVKNWQPFWTSERAAIELVSIYFNRVRSFSTDLKIIEALCSEYVNDLKNPDSVVRTIYRVERFHAPKSFNLSDGINFRPVNHDDIDRYCRLTIFNPSLQPRLSDKDWILEIEHSGPKAAVETYNNYNSIIEQIISAMQIAASGRAIFTLLSHAYKSPFLQMGIVSGGNFIPSGRSGNINLDDAIIEEFQKFYKAVVRIGSEEKLKHLRLPIRRLHISSNRIDKEDHLVDVVIGLERLLAYDSRGEISFRFRIRGASILSDLFGTTGERISFLSKLYGIRSGVVHADTEESAVDEFGPKAEEALKEILRWYINRIDSPSFSLKKILSEIDEKCVTRAVGELSLT